MIGVVLCGGLGTRLLPLTKAVNKHLLPVDEKPMCYYPLEKLAQANIKRVVIVVGGKSTGAILQTIGNGRELGLESVSYVYQEGEGGIADALMCAKDWTRDEDICVVLGDNVFTFDLHYHIERFYDTKLPGHVLLTKVGDPKQYGVPHFGKDGKIEHIYEKPADAPEDSYAVIGVYMYQRGVYGWITELDKSERNELEISDLNNKYAKKGWLGFSIVPHGTWFDAGASFDALISGTQWLRSKKSAG